MAASPATVPAGSATTLTGACFPPNQDVSLTLTSDPVSLGTVRTDANGRYTKVVTIPRSTARGSHTITAVSGASRSSVVIDVTRMLPVTGRSLDKSLTAGVAFVLLGMALTFVPRPAGAHYARRRD